MGNEWKTEPAEAFCSSVRDGTHDSPKPVDSGKPLITSRHIIGGRIDYANAYLISDEDYIEINRRSKVDKGDVLISMIGTVGEPCLVDHEPEFAIKNIGLFKTKNEDSGRYLYYFLKSPDAQNHIKSQSRGTTQAYMPLNALRAFPIRYPNSPKAMKSIAHILGTLDDKIELLRSMNETLEAMARALFKSWFIDFDPVRKKANGQPTGLPPENEALFPDSFEDSELGEIPKGWEVLPLGEAIEIAGGSTPSTKEMSFWDGSYWFATPKDLSMAISPILTKTERRITQNGIDQITSGQLPAGTLLLSSRAPIGYLAITSVPVSINQGFIAIKKESTLSPYYMYSWCKEYMDTIIGHANGTTFLEISKTNFRTIKSIIPPKKIIDEYHTYAKFHFDLIECNTKELLCLTKIRDSLLPKLISGDLELTEKMIRSITEKLS